MKRLVPALLLVSGLMFTAAPYIVRAAPVEASMGLVSRIFYFHVPVAIVFLTSAIVCGLASLAYLVKRADGADRLAVASGELAVVFGLIVLGTGPLWARKAWGVWWEWDARLTSTFVMWMVFNAYLLLRRFGGPGSETLAAAVGFFGMMLVPFVYWSVDFWRTMHPKTTVLITLPASMAVPMAYCVVAFFILYGALLALRVRLEAERGALERAFLLLED